VLDSLLSSYERIRRIRERYGELKDEGVPADAFDGLQQYASAQMQLDVQSLAERLVDEHRQQSAGKGVNTSSQ